FENLETFDGEGDGVASAKAKWSDAAFEVAAFQFIEQGNEDARAARANGMTERDRAAVDVYFFGIEFELTRDGDGGDGKGFVQLDQINIFVAVPACLREELFDGLNGRHHHPLRLDAADGLRDDARDRLLAKP